MTVVVFFLALSSSVFSNKVLVLEVFEVTSRFLSLAPEALRRLRRDSLWLRVMSEPLMRKEKCLPVSGMERMASLTAFA